MEEKVKLTGIFEEGYGISPKLVMRDKDLSIEAKAIYAYMSSFAGNGNSAFPSIGVACKDLNVSEKRFRKHRDQLIDKGYITIQKNKNDKGKFENNIYIINHTVKTSVRTKRHDGKMPSRQNDRTNNNSSFNNNSYLISSSSGAENPFTFYEQNFGLIGPFIQESIEHWCKDLSDELVIEAMKIALKAGKGFDYAEGTMKRWHAKNIKTLDDVKAAEVEFKNNRKTNKRKSVDDIDWDNL